MFDYEANYQKAVRNSNPGFTFDSSEARQFKGADNAYWYTVKVTNVTTDGVIGTQTNKSTKVCRKLRRFKKWEDSPNKYDKDPWVDANGKPHTRNGVFVGGC